MPSEQFHFITGRLAETALRGEVERLANARGFGYSVQVMPISVAALMTGRWIAERMVVPAETTAIVLPGYCAAGLEEVAARAGLPVRLGPRDLRDLPEMFGEPGRSAGLGPWDIEILAEINHAPRLEPAEFERQARSLAADGADLIDIGCEPAGGWQGLGDCVRRLRDQGLRVSVDSFDPNEVAAAVKAGAELVLSVNSSNLAHAADWGCEVVVVPDDPDKWESMEATLGQLAARGVPFRIDPVLEPACVGLAASLARYHAARQRWPEAAFLMGTGNVTELTDADSAPLNLLLLGICQELGIRSVLTTQVINWARTSVRECAIARQMTWLARRERSPLKRLSDQLVIARDARLAAWPDDQLQQLASQIRDRNYRLFSGKEKLSACGDGQLWQDVDPFALFDRLLATQRPHVGPEHAFYLGYELCKAELAMQLGKRYIQDESLDWGYLTVREPERHRLMKRNSAERLTEPDGEEAPPA